MGFTLVHRHAYRTIAAIVLLMSVLPAEAQDLAAIPQQKPFRYSGSTTLQGGPYFFSGDGQGRNQPWFWNANGQLTLSLYGWDVPFSFSVGSQERRWTQPFNRYGASPHYKWVKLHAGYRSIKFNPYTHSGLQFFGGGVELDPKGFRFGAFYGRFNKPIAQDTLASITPTPTYDRTGYGVRIGAGTARTFIDLMLVKVWDDSSSIPEVTNVRVAPMENLAVGASSRIGFSRKLFMQFDLGATALTADTRLPKNEDIEVPSFATGLFDPRIGSKALFAGNAAITWNDRHLTLKVTAKQIDPGYRSLAAVYQQTDVRSFTVEPALRLAKGKLRLGGTVGHQLDNVRHNKVATSVRTIGSASVSWNPSRTYGVDANYANYGIQQQAGLRVLNDTFRVALANRSYGLTQRYLRANDRRVWTVTLAAGMQQLQDLNPLGTFAGSENEVLYGNLNIMRVRNRDNLSVSGGLNASQNTVSTGTSMLIGPMLGVSKQFGRKKAVVGLNCAWNMALQNGDDAGSTLNGNATLQVPVNDKHRFNLTITALNNRTAFVATREFTEVRVLGGYTFLLRPKS